MEAPQTLDEVKAVPKRVAGPCLLNVVRRGKTPPIELAAAEAMGYKLAILPTLLFRGVIGCCEELLAELKTGVFPAPPKDLSPQRGVRPLRRRGMGCAARALSRGATAAAAARPYGE